MDPVLQAENDAARENLDRNLEVLKKYAPQVELPSVPIKAIDGIETPLIDVYVNSLNKLTKLSTPEKDIEVRAPNVETTEEVKLYVSGLEDTSNDPLIYDASDKLGGLVKDQIILLIFEEIKKLVSQVKNPNLSNGDLNDVRNIVENTNIAVTHIK